MEAGTVRVTDAAGAQIAAFRREAHGPRRDGADPPAPQAAGGGRRADYHFCGGGEQRMSLRKMICITCPRGCHLTVGRGDPSRCRANRCPKGGGVRQKRGHRPAPGADLHRPAGGVRRRLAACRSRPPPPIPKNLLMQAMRAVNAVTVTAPVKTGDRGDPRPPRHRHRPHRLQRFSLSGNSLAAPVQAFRGDGAGVPFVCSATRLPDRFFTGREQSRGLGAGPLRRRGRGALWPLCDPPA